MKVLLTLLLIFSTVSLFADTTNPNADITNVRPSWSGAWFNADHSGHGISVEVLDDERTIFYWYTYDQDGNPIWLLAEGVNSRVHFTGLFLPFIRVEATAYYYEGMVFGEFDPAASNRREWGTIILDFPWWQCNTAHMEWFPTMEGFTHGATDLVRLTSLYGLDCIESQGTAGDWEVQFGFDAEFKYPVEIVATPDPINPELTDLLFEFIDETDCLWSGEIYWGFDLVEASWSNQCGVIAEEHTGTGRQYFECRLCDAKNNCAWKDEVMIFEDEGEYLIFSR